MGKTGPNGTYTGQKRERRRSQGLLANERSGF
jgi:hypothetical protein